MNEKSKLPQAELMQSLMDSFNSMAAKFSELQQTHLEHIKKIIDMNVESGKTFSQVKDKEQFIAVWESILKHNGSVFTQVFLDSLNQNIKLWYEMCDSSSVNSAKIKDLSVKFINFYSQLVPSNEVFELGGMIRNAATGNQQSIDALKDLAKSALKQFGEQVKSSAEQTMNILSEVNQKNK